MVRGSKGAKGEEVAAGRKSRQTEGVTSPAPGMLLQCPCYPSCLELTERWSTV